jgi:hypothetical protein
MTKKKDLAQPRRVGKFFYSLDHSCSNCGRRLGEHTAAEPFDCPAGLVRQQLTSFVPVKP